MENSLGGGHVHANGVRQHFLRFGGPIGARSTRGAVVVVPGITSPAITWSFVGSAIGAHFDCYVLDVRGRGLSEAGPTLDYSLDAQAADLNAFASALGLQRYSVLGHSMGARIAIRAARARPVNMVRVILAEPPLSGPGRRSYPATLAWYLDAIRIAQRGCGIEDMRRFCPTWSDSQLQLRAEWLHTCDPRAIEASFRGFHEDDIHADLAKIDIPTRLLAAEFGDVIQAQDVAELGKLAPGIDVVRVPNAGHMLPWDNEAGFYAAIGDFLGASIQVNSEHPG